MSIHPEVVGPVPADTARVARRAFPKGNRLLSIRDELGAIFEDAEFVPLFATRGRPAMAPWRLMLTLLLQYLEGFSDREAADAVRARIDWKYVLGLSLEDPGFDSTVLCEFRARLAQNDPEQLILDKLLDQCQARGWVHAGGRQRTDSTHVLGAIHALNRIGCVREAMRHALNELAEFAPEWLVSHSSPEWLDRYSLRDPHWGARGKSMSPEDQERIATMIGVDGYLLMDAAHTEQVDAWIAHLPALDTLRRIWIQQYYVEDGRVRWRTKAEGIPPARQCINSPHDPEARLAIKRSLRWVGYRAHLTESCDEEGPHLITHVETTLAPLADTVATDRVHQALQQKVLLPAQHLVDTGYLDANLLITTAEQYGVDLVGPTRHDYHWQAQTGSGFEKDRFLVDWKHARARCPESKWSESWTHAVDGRGKPVIKIKFSLRDCKPCPVRSHCTRGLRRSITVAPEQRSTALERARARERTREFKSLYGKRSGIEGTVSQGVRAMGLRRSRYVGLRKSHLKHVLTAAAINLQRIGDWIDGRERATTRSSRFSRLMFQAETA